MILFLQLLCDPPPVTCSVASCQVRRKRARVCAGCALLLVFSLKMQEVRRVMVTGGKRAAQGGSFFEPTVLTDVTTDMVITKEETFGPVAPLYRFKNEGEAISMANDTEFG